MYTTAYDRQLVVSNGQVVLVRGISPGDAPLLIRIFEGLSPTSRRYFRPHRFTPEGAAEVIGTASDPNGIYFIALAGAGEPVGYGYLHDLRSGLPELGIAITDRWQNRGVGKEFVQFLVGVAEHLGMDGVSLSVDDDNVPAICTYERAGFELIRKLRQMRLVFPEHPRQEAGEGG